MRMRLLMAAATAQPRTLQQQQMVVRTALAVQQNAQLEVMLKVRRDAAASCAAL